MEMKKNDKKNKRKKLESKEWIHENRKKKNK